MKIQSLSTHVHNSGESVEVSLACETSLELNSVMALSKNNQSRWQPVLKKASEIK